MLILATMKKAPEHFRVTQDVVTKYPHLRINPVFVSEEGFGNNGAFYLPKVGKDRGYYFFCKISDGMGWEHVSVSIPTENRSPTWEEMCYIKDVFWDEEEVVLQFHPAKSEYVNNHNYCLHLWRSTTVEIPVPHSKLVGAK